jgi:hypothetical protein
MAGGLRSGFRGLYNRSVLSIRQNPLAHPHQCAAYMVRACKIAHPSRFVANGSRSGRYRSAEHRRRGRLFRRDHQFRQVRSRTSCGGSCRANYRHIVPLAALLKQMETCRPSCAVVIFDLHGQVGTKPRRGRTLTGCSFGSGQVCDTVMIFAASSRLPRSSRHRRRVSVEKGPHFRGGLSRPGTDPDEMPAIIQRV